MIPGNANSLLLASAAADAAAAGPTRSLRFNSGDSAYLNRTPSSAGNRKTWTWSAWVKRSKLGERVALFTAGSDNTEILFEPDDKLRIYFFPSGAYAGHTKTVASFRDTSAWYHIVFAIDTTQTGNDNIVKIYVNGVEQEVTHPNNWTTNGETDVNNTVAQYIGSRFGPGRLINAYMADIYLIDGSQLEPTSFGAFDDNGVWQAAAYSGTFGTNGFHLNFADGSDLGADNSGNGNDFTPNNLVGTVDVADVSVASATGALPIYNTTDTYGATQGTGTRTDSDASSLVLAIPFLSNQNDVHATVKGSGSNKTVSGSGASASSTKDKFYGGSFRFDGSTATPMNVADSDDFTFDGDFTVEAWVWPDATNAFQIVTSKWDVGGQEFILAIDSNGKAEFHWAPYSDGGPAIESAAGVVNAKAWNHLAAVRSSGTITLYVNGTSVGTRSNSTAATNRSTLLTIGYLQYLGGNKLAGYLQDLRIYKGAAKYTSNFNPPSDPADKLPGEGLDLLFDVPTNGTQSDTGAGGEVSGNYACFNSLDTPWTLSNGNLDATAPGSPNRSYCPATIFVNSGKYYAEFTLTNNSTSTSPQVGVVKQGDAQGYIGNTGTGGVGYEPATDRVINAGTSTVPFYNTAYTSAGVVVGLGLDMDAGTLVGYVNGTSIGTLATGLSGYYAFACGDINGSGVPEVVVNFGQRAFAYGNAGTNRPAATYKALCTTNLPTPTIADGSDYFEAKTYTGNGSTQSITGFEFSPDWVWYKDRGSTNGHALFDSVRGAQKRLRTMTTAAEVTDSTYLTSFNSDGFTVGSHVTGNTSGSSYIAWCWDAGSSTVSNTDGSITSSVRANQTAGFSIVTYSVPSSGTTFSVGHGLGAAPSLIIAKDRDAANPWGIYHSALGAGKGLLFSTAAEQVNSNWWNNTNPTSTLFYLNTGIFAHSQPGNDYVAYCFAPVAGYSAFSSFEANGAVDGPFVHTGFRPALIIFKNIDDSENWLMIDSTRNSANPVSSHIHPNLSNAEAEGSPPWADFLSNGFKLRNLYNETNGSGDTIVFMAWAENPFQANGGLAR